MNDCQPIKFQFGIDAPICQNTRLDGLGDVLARAEVCHNSLLDLAGEQPRHAPGIDRAEALGASVIKCW